MSIVARESQVIVIDVGGTLFRSARVGVAGQLEDRRTTPAISMRNYPGKSTADLQKDLLAYLITEARFHRAVARGSCTVGVSVGAALHHRTGVIWNSGPLWGGSNVPFELSRKLREQAPEFDWHITNDVTAALLAVIAQGGHPVGRDICYVTVSTGIAARIWFANTAGIVVDDVAGLQGEIGHIPVTAEFQGKTLPLTCDCGGLHHLNAVSSGRGIEAVLDHIRCTIPEISRELNLVSGGDHAATFKAALDRGSPIARELLSTCLRPLAQVVLTMIACNPSIARIYFGGGVPTGLGLKLWRDAFLQVLDLYGAYQISGRYPEFFGEMIRVVDGTDLSLLGAGWIASQTDPVYLSAVPSA